VRPVRAPWALILALGTLLAFDQAVRRLPDDWCDSTVSIPARVAFVREQLVPLAPHPTVVILGSSRSALNIAAGKVEVAAGLPQGSVLNLSVPGVAAYGIYTMFLAERPRILGARLVLYNVDEFFLTGLDSEFMLEEPLTTQLARTPLDQKPRVVLDNLFPYRRRLPWVLTRAEVRLGLRPSLPSLGYRIVDGRLLRLGAEADPDHDVDHLLATIENYYEESRMVRRSAELLQVPGRAAREAGVGFAYVQIPNRPTHRRLVLERHGAGYRTHLARMEAVASAVGAPFYDWSEGFCPMGDDAFVDGVHATLAGADQLSRCLGEWLKTREELRAAR
jgi:hypothetical protein